MILKEATIKYKGYNPDDLKLHSGKRICCACDICGRVRWVPKNNYRSLCLICSRPDMLGKNNSFYGKKHSEKTRQKMSDNHYDCSGKNNPSFGKTGKLSPIYGDKNGFYGKKHTNATKEKNRLSHLGENSSMWGKFGKDAPNWKGGISYPIYHKLPEYKCIKLNKRFDNSEFHHITKLVGVFIPRYLHRQIKHSLKTGNNMIEINNLTMNYLINGEL